MTRWVDPVDLAVWLVMALLVLAVVLAFTQGR